jgi:hypothetical protein
MLAHEPLHPFAIHRSARLSGGQGGDHPANSSASLRPGLAREPLGARREELLTPLPEQAVGDLMLAAQLGQRLRAAQRREHDLGLLLRRELPVLTGLAQRILSIIEQPIL